MAAGAENDEASTDHRKDKAKGTTMKRRREHTLDLTKKNRKQRRRRRRKIDAAIKTLVHRACAFHSIYS